MRKKKLTRFISKLIKFQLENIPTSVLLDPWVVRGKKVLKLEWNTNELNLSSKIHKTGIAAVSSQESLKIFDPFLLI